MLFMYFFTTSADNNKINSNNIKANMFIGNWKGSRDINSNKCKFFTWHIARYKDGKYIIKFYSDKKQTKLISQETGKWWIKDNKYFSILPEIMNQPDIYSYSIYNSKSILFTDLSLDDTADCQDNYSFLDIKIK